MVGSGDGEIDHPLLSRLLVRRITPHPTRISRSAIIHNHFILISYHTLCTNFPCNLPALFFILLCYHDNVIIFCSRKANIPGYAGHTHWARREPAHSDLPHPNPLTTARTHRYYREQYSGTSERACPFFVGSVIILEPQSVSFLVSFLQLSRIFQGIM